MEEAWRKWRLIEALKIECLGPINYLGAIRYLSADRTCVLDSIQLRDQRDLMRMVTMLGEG